MNLVKTFRAVCLVNIIAGLITLACLYLLLALGPKAW
jgi:hypothetical protein